MIFDAAAVSGELAAALRDEADALALRRTVVAILSRQMEQGRAAIAAGLAEHPFEARGATRAYTWLTDCMVLTAFEVATRHLHPLNAPTRAERISVLGVGGYGRGEMAPHSDVDLLFLTPYKVTGWAESVIESMLYILWDLRLKVGHSSRTIRDCLRLGAEDFTIRTALLENRWLAGDAELAGRLNRELWSDLFRGSEREFTEAKLEERDERHEKQGGQRYMVEPNVKEGKGGLRDLQSLFWIAKYVYHVTDAAQLVRHGLFTEEEYARFTQAETFLWAVRCHLHLITGRPSDQLTFDLQVEVAERMGYKDTAGRRAVEHFMQDYFRHATSVGDLTRIFLTKLEAAHVKSEPLLQRLFRRRKKLKDGYAEVNGRLAITDEGAFLADPLNLLRVFEEGLRTGLLIHPDAMRLVTANLHLIDDGLRADPVAQKLFLDLMLKHGNPERALRRMNELGVLSAFIPEFEPVVAMMQFNMYHHYTVDEHLLRCIGVLAEIERGEAEKAHPLAHSLMPGLKKRREALYVAMLLHDIAKGRPEDHSEAGARIARRICPHMGLSEEDTETVSWLVEHHLLMSMTAQTRDLNDRKTVEDFADVVQSVERLKLLLVLTICDIRGVGPGVWNGWKGQLLRTLYYETELLLTGGFSEVSRGKRAEEARRRLADALADWPERDRNRYVRLHYENYLLTVDLEDQLRHASFIRDADRSHRQLATMIRPLEFEAVTEITVLAPDHPRLLSVIAGACAAAGANIVDAQIFTTSDGRALDTILISREFARDDDEQRRGERVGRLIEDVLSGKSWLPQIIQQRVRQQRRGARPFRLEPHAEVRNALSNRFSVIEVEGLDRTGLLSEITGAISDLSLDIASAHITTFGEKVIDTFYVTDLTGHKIENPARMAAIREKLISILAGETPAAAAPAARETVAAK